MDKTEKKSTDGKSTLDDLAAIWIDGLTPSHTNNTLNKLRLASDIKEYAAQELDAYKARLKKAIHEAIDDPEGLVDRDFIRANALYQLIDKL